jgi:hypothetical protein
MRRKKDTPLSDTEKFVLDSTLVNGDIDTAYLLCHKSKAADSYQHVLALRWMRSDAVKAYLNTRKGFVIFVGDKTAEQKDSSLVDYTKRDNLINALSTAANEEQDTIRRTKILSELADLMRMDKEDNKAEKELTHFYLPLTCKRCSLYVQAEKKKQEGTPE